MNAKNYFALSAVMCIYIGLATKSKTTSSSPVILKQDKITEIIKKQEPRSVTDPSSLHFDVISRHSTSRATAEEKKEITRTIIITNSVTDDMICYTKLNQKYKPDTFAIRVNGTALTQGKNTKITVTNNKLNVEYDFSFARGWYKGTRKKSFKLDSNTDSTKLTFNWNNKHRVSLAGAKVDTLS